MIPGYKDVNSLTIMSTERKTHPKGITLIVLCLALAIIIIDGTVLNVSISYLIRDLNTDLNGIQWVITAYSLVLAALTITGGRLGDIFGRKRMFKLGASLFALGSFIASISTNVTILFWGWSVIEGVGAALMMPATASLIMSTFQGKQRALAFGIWGGVAGASGAIGPILGGWLTTNWSWHWAFRINLFTVLALLLGSFVITESYGSKKQNGFDLVGVLLSSLGLVSLVYGLTKATTYGWWHAKQAFPLGSLELEPFGLSIVPFFIALGLMIIAAFVVWEIQYEDKGKTPLVSMHLLRNRQFSAGLLTTMIIVMGQSGLIFALPVFLQSVKSLDAFHTGLALLPMSLSIFIAAPLAGSLSRTVKPRLIIQTGLLAGILGAMVLHFSLSATATTQQLIPGLICFGIGMGMVNAQITNTTLSAVEIKDAGEASGVSSTARQLGQSLGMAIIGTIFISVITGQMQTLVGKSSTIPQPMKAAMSAQAEQQSAASQFSPSETAPADPISLEMISIKNEAMAAASRTALAFTAFFAAICFFVTFSLPNRQIEDKPKATPQGH